MLAPKGGFAREGDVVLVLRGHLNFTPVLLKGGEVLHCKEGKFRHDDIIGQPLGTCVVGRSNIKDDPHPPPTLFVLQNSTDLWTLAVPHRTQIIYDTDIAVIIFNLRLGPGCRVAEAGTGSGSLTHSLANAVAPDGIVYTFDFHKGRCLDARRELRQNGIPASLVTCNWRDVCSTSVGNNCPGKENANGGNEGVVAGVEEEFCDDTTPKCGFGLPKHHVDAVFLDMPAPWLAIDNVLHILRPGGMLCTFSPCIEQTQRTAQRLRQEPHEFVDIRTMEAITRYINPVNKKRGREEVRDGKVEGEEGQWQEQSFRPKFRTATVSKGHSAYLTFARRRLEALPIYDQEGCEINDDNPRSTKEDQGRK